MNNQDEAVSGAELVARAAALVPALRMRARAAEENGRIPEETVDDLKAAGLFRAVVPKRFAGYEVDFKYIPQIFRELGRGCTSTAWAMGFLIYHNFQFAHFSERAQEDAWGGRGYTMAPGQVMPSGLAVPVDGGFQLSGRWGYATGIQHGDWMLLKWRYPSVLPAGIRIHHPRYLARRRHARHRQPRCHFGKCVRARAPLHPGC